MDIFRPDDLTSDEQALLGVLCVGLPPARAAGDEHFRVDHVTAVVCSLFETGENAAYLDEDELTVLSVFRTRLKNVISNLADRGILADQPAGMPAPPGSFEAGLAIDLVNPDEHPAVLDRVLAQQCMEVLLRNSVIYPYLMERYSASGEVWRKLREQGYGD
jgi:hypothetical protein